jgi:hypothetical protein
MKEENMTISPSALQDHAKQAVKGAIDTWQVERIFSGYQTFLSGIIIIVFWISNSVALAQSCASLPAGIISWWPGEGNAYDIIGNNNGVLNNSANFAQGVVGQAFSFNRSQGAYISVPNSPSLNVGSGDLSMEAWIKPTAQRFASIMDKRGSGYTGYHLYLDDNTHFGVQINGPTGVGLSVVAKTFIYDGKFHHVAVTIQRNSSTGGKQFVDGILVNTFDPTPAKGNIDNQANFSLGGHNFGSPTFDGLIDEFSFYKRALSDAEIAAIYNAGSAGKCKSSRISLLATPISPAVIQLSWNNPHGIKSYRLQRKPGDCNSTDPWATLADVKTSTTTLQDKNLLPDTSYSYQIATYYGGGSFSDYSACASATTASAGTPETPSTLRAYGGAGRVELNWADNSEDETGFNIYRQAGTGTLGLLDTVAAGVGHYTDTSAMGNDAATAYQYDVRACNAAGCSLPVPAVAVPFAPRNLTATPATKAIGLVWRDKSSNETGFQVWRKNGDCSSDNPWSQLAKLKANTHAYSDPIGVQGQVYSYRVRATYSTGVPLANFTRSQAYGFSRFSGCVSATAP